MINQLDRFPYGYRRGVWVQTYYGQQFLQRWVGTYIRLSKSWNNIIQLLKSISSFEDIGMTLWESLAGTCKRPSYHSIWGSWGWNIIRTR